MRSRDRGEIPGIRRVSSREELDACLAELPPPRDGLVRVFRGQAAEYLLPDTKAPSIAPSLSRSGFIARDPDPVWLIAAIQAMRKVGALGKTDDMAARDVWAPALLQHYGARSHFVDVTRDIEVALWFACHDLVVSWVSALPPVTLRGWAEQQLAVATYEPVTAGATPMLYVLDVPRWEHGLHGASGRLTSGRHGELIEVEAASEGGGLQLAASRLAKQKASLVWCDPHTADGGSIHEALVGRFSLDGAMAVALSAQLGKPLHDVFPHADEDAMYRALLAIPMILHFEPESIRHPLSVPLYVTTSPGRGTTAAPLRLGRVDAADEGARELSSYLAALTLRSPAFLHSDLMASNEDGARLTAPLVVAGERFAFSDALPLLVDAPLWSVTPGCHDPVDRGMWIESALRIGLPDEVEGRQSRSVYVELSPIDGTDGGGPELRGVWVARAADDVAVRAFFVQDGDVSAVQLRFNWGADGTLHPSSLPGLPKRPLQGSLLESHLLKSAFATFAILRQLVPGFKPPAAHAYRGSRADGTPVYQPGVVLEPACGKVEFVEGRYLRPKAIDGSIFSFASGFAGDLDIGDARARLELWRELVPRVTDPCYVVSAGIPLVEHLAYFDEFAAARHEIARIRSVLATASQRSFDDVVDTLEAQLMIATGELADARRLLLTIAERASVEGRRDAAEACRALAARPVKRHWGKVQRVGPLEIVTEPAGDPCFIL